MLKGDTQIAFLLFFFFSFSFSFFFFIFLFCDEFIKVCDGCDAKVALQWYQDAHGGDFCDLCWGRKSASARPPTPKSRKPAKTTSGNSAASSSV
mgnify:CR=1 FL=1